MTIQNQVSYSKPYEESFSFPIGKIGDIIPLYDPDQTNKIGLPLINGFAIIDGIRVEEKGFIHTLRKIKR